MYFGALAEGMDLGGVLTVGFDFDKGVLGLGLRELSFLG